jgi:hypothetical protein
MLASTSSASLLIRTGVGQTARIIPPKVRASSSRTDEVTDTSGAVRRRLFKTWLSASRPLAGVGDIHRFADWDSFAWRNGTAALNASSGNQQRDRLSRAGYRRITATYHGRRPKSATPPKDAPTTTRARLRPARCSNLFSALPGFAWVAAALLRIWHPQTAVAGGPRRACPRQAVPAVLPSHTRSGGSPSRVGPDDGSPSQQGLAPSSSERSSGALKPGSTCAVRR